MQMRAEWFQKQVRRRRHHTVNDPQRQISRQFASEQLYYHIIIMASRALFAARRVVTAVPAVRPSALPNVQRRLMSGDHHDHRVFSPPYNPTGAPSKYCVRFVRGVSCLERQSCNDP